METGMWIWLRFKQLRGISSPNNYVQFLLGNGDGRSLQLTRLTFCILLFRLRLLTLRATGGRIC